MKLFNGTAALLFITILSSLRPTPTLTANAIQLENAKAGTTEWKLTNTGYTSGVIEGYASLTSVNRGGQIALFVNTAEPSYKMDIFRVGYYGGTGGRRMLNTLTRTGVAQPKCPEQLETGMIECDWIAPYILNIPRTADPTDWMTGVYLVKLTAGTSGKQQYIMFAVRDDLRSSDLLLAQTVNTSQAYNVWGGKSLYGTIANRGDTADAAHKVSFNRPYYGEGNTAGAGSFGWELNMLTWLEREGYDVSYATNVDVDNDPNLLLNHKAFLSVGHDEYWTWRMRDNVERARDTGVNLGFFSGNTSYWQVRYEPSLVDNAPARTLVGYKEAWRTDPITPDYLKTNQFRFAPVNRPESTMMGVSYITQARPAMVIEDASSWVFTGTGLRNGDRLTEAGGVPFLGYEIDAMGPQSPANVQRLAHSPATPSGANFSDMTIYRAASGATVFASGSIGWSQMVPQVQQITRNVLARFITGAFSDTVPIRPALPVPFEARDIGNVGRPGFVGLAGADSFVLNGAGQNAFQGQDAIYYAYQPLSGEVEITARLNGLQLYWGNRAGIMIRDSLSATAKYVSLVGRPSESRGALLEGVDLRIKDVTGDSPRKVAAYDLNLPNWLKLTRTCDVFNAFASADGATWVPIGSVTVPMASTVFVGLSVASAQYGVWATAKFDRITVTGNTPDGLVDSTAPVIAVSSPAAGSTIAGSVTLSAAASDNVGIRSVQFQVDRVNVGAADTAAPYTHAWASTGVLNGTHTITAVAHDLSNNVSCASISATVKNPTGLLPAGWNHADIGAVGTVGSASFDASTSAFTVAGAGADVWNTADAFQYTYTTLSGDGQIVARVQSVQNVAPWTKAGVMVRATLAPDSAHAFMLVSAGKGLSFQRRTATGSLSVGTAGPQAAAPRWVRVDRAGSVLTAYQSTDGATWTLVGSEAIPMGTQVFVGLAVGSHTTSAAATAVFDNVAVRSAATPANCAVTVAPQSSVIGAGTPGTAIAATWFINVTAGACTWNAKSDVDWLEIKNPTTSLYVHVTQVSFAGSVAMKVHALTNTAPKRTGHFIINGVIYAVTQGGA